MILVPYNLLMSYGFEPSLWRKKERPGLWVTQNAIGLKLNMVIPINNTTCAK